MANIHFDFRRGGGAGTEILYGEVSIRPTTSFARGTSLVVPANTTLDLVDGEATLANLAATPAPVEGSIEWAYVVKVTDRLGKSFEWMVGVPDTPDTVEFANLPRYYETKPPLFGQGPPGPAGDAGTITVGTVVSGSTPSVTNSGTNQDAILDFVLPKGDKGDTGVGVPAGGTASQYIRKNSANTTTEWVSASGAVATGTQAGFMPAADKALIDGATYEPDPNTLMKRSASGRVNHPDPVSAQNPITVNWFNGNIDNHVEGVVEDPDSLTRIALDELYAQKGLRVFNVMDFGANADGVTSDVTPINLAITAASDAGGGIVFMPSGNYYMQTYATLKSHVTVQGTGNTIINVDGGGSTAKFAILSNGAKGYGSGGTNMGLKKLTFKGSFANARGIGALGANHGSNILIEDCVFIEAHRYGHIFDLQGCDNVIIRGCKFYGADYSGSTAYLTSEAIQLDYSTRTGASVTDATGSYDGLPTKDVIIENCEFRPLQVGATFYPCPNPVGTHFTVEGYWVDNVTFRNNVVERPWEDTVNSLRGTLHFVAARNVHIHDNHFFGTNNRTQRLFATYGLTSAFPVATVDDSGQASVPLATPSVCQSIKIHNNKFENFSTSSTTNDLLYLNGQDTSGYVNDIQVAGNSFIGCYPPSASDNIGVHLMYPRYAKSVTIQNNFADRARRLVFFGQVVDLKIIGNTVLYGGTAGDVNGNTADGLKVINNEFVSTGLGIYATTSTSVHVMGNRINTRIDATSVIDMNIVTKYIVEGNIINCPTTVARGIVARGDSDPGIVKNNIVTGATAAVITDASSTPIVSDNILG